MEDRSLYLLKEVEVGVQESLPKAGPWGCSREPPGGVWGCRDAELPERGSWEKTFGPVMKFGHGHLDLLM